MAWRFNETPFLEREVGFFISGKKGEKCEKYCVLAE
jgi:hypothetical protein